MSLVRDLEGSGFCISSTCSERNPKYKWHETLLKYSWDSDYTKQRIRKFATPTWPGHVLMWETTEIVTDGCKQQVPFFSCNFPSSTFVLNAPSYVLLHSIVPFRPTSFLKLFQVTQVFLPLHQPPTQPDRIFKIFSCSLFLPLTWQAQCAVEASWLSLAPMRAIFMSSVIVTYIFHRLDIIVS